jgi:hypothetical protein
LTAAGLDTKKNRALLFKSDPAEAGYWKLCQQILHALGHGENSPLYDYALCLYLYQDTRTALSHWGKGRAGIEGAFPDLGALKAFCSEMSRGTSVPGDEVSTTELLREKETAREVGMNGADMEGLLEFALNFPGARIADFIEDSAESHYTRTFSAMHAESDEAANDGTGVVAINGARRLAVVAREEEEREVVADADWIQKAAEARKKEDALIGRFTESVGGPRTTCPTLEVLQKWAKNLASLVSASEIATLPERYPSLLISVREAPSKNLSFEAAFVRKAVELVNRDRERKKDAEKGDSGRRVFSLNL